MSTVAAITAVLVLGALLAWTIWLDHTRRSNQDRDLIAEIRALRHTRHDHGAHQ